MTPLERAGRQLHNFTPREAADVWLSRLESDGIALSQRELTDAQLDKFARLVNDLGLLAVAMAKRNRRFSGE